MGRRVGGCIVARRGGRVALITGASSGSARPPRAGSRASPARSSCSSRAAPTGSRRSRPRCPRPRRALALDLLDDDAPGACARALEERHGGRLHAARQQRRPRRRAARSPRPATRSSAARWRSTSTRSSGSPRRCCRSCARSAPSAIVNVASTAGPRRAARRRRVLRLQGGASPSGATACAPRRHAHGVHVGTVMPGFIPTEGFPQRELAARRATRWMLGTPEEAADAISTSARRPRRALRAALLRRARRAADRRAAPRPARMGGRGASVFATRTRRGRRAPRRVRTPASGGRDRVVGDHHGRPGRRPRARACSRS